MATIINGDGIVTAEGTSTTQGRLRLGEDTDNGTNYVELQAAANIASNVTFTLPSADGTSGQVLQTNGSGALSFATPAGGSWTYISSVTANNSATASFTGLSSTYDVYVVELVQVKPVTSSYFSIRTSTNNGSSYDSGASDYAYTLFDKNIANVSSFDFENSTGDTKIYLTGGSNVGNGVNQTGVSGFVYIYKPSAAQYCSIQTLNTFVDGSTRIVIVNGMGRRLAAADVDAIQFLFETGNITSGTFHLYGIKNS